MPCNFHQLPTPKLRHKRVPNGFYAVSGLRRSHLRFMRLLQLSAVDLGSYQQLPAATSLITLKIFEISKFEAGTLGHWDTGTPTWRWHKHRTRSRMPDIWRSRSAACAADALRTVPQVPGLPAPQGQPPLTADQPHNDVSNSSV